MSVKRWLIAAVVLVLVGVGAFIWLRPKPPKHYIIIVSDAMRADHFGCYGDKNKVTPNIDAFAAKNLIFTKAYTVAPWTFAANGAMFTGMYPHEVCDGDSAMLVDQATTMAEYFKQAGYKTSAFSAHPIISKKWNMDQGFETFWGGDATSNPEIDDQVLSKSLAWLKDHWQEKTFTLIYFFNPHEPYRPDRISNELKAELSTLRPVIQLGGIPLYPIFRKPIIVDKITGDEGFGRVCTRPEIAALHALYYACINTADRRIGKILEKFGDAPDAVVAVMSDHGEEWLDHGGLRHKEMLYDELLHIPLIIHIPGQKARVIDHTVSNLDVAATFLALAKIEPKTRLQGESLLAPPDSNGAGHILFSSSYHSRGFDKRLGTPEGITPPWIERYAIRANGHALIHTLSGWPDDDTIPKGGRWEYYDLKADPREQVTLPLDQSGQELIPQLMGFEKLAKQQVKQENVSEEDLQKKMEDMKNLGYIGGK